MADILIPDPLSSDRQYERFYNLDLPELGDEEITDELHYLRPLLWGLPAEHWLRERTRKLESEIRKRGYDARYKPSQQPKPKSAEGVKL